MAVSCMIQPQENLRNVFTAELPTNGIAQHVVFRPVLLKDLTGQVHRAALKDIALTTSEMNEG